MADSFTPERRSEIMSRIRSRGNRTTELRLIEIMRKNGIKGWRRGSNLPGKPDFIFTRARVAVFVDGDFWHGNPSRFRLPKSNEQYWSKKIHTNQARDREIDLELTRRGWRVIRIWESSLKEEAEVVSTLSLMVKQ
ncbi:MAG: very short patch repair endonuclease [Isosphaeraceae bacterium]